MLQEETLQRVGEGVTRYPAAPRPEQTVQAFRQGELRLMALHFFLPHPEQLLALAQVELAPDKAGRQRGARRQRARLHGVTE